jgi:translocation and assembly module TamB
MCIRDREAMIAPSPDVIIVDDPEGEVAGRDLPMALDLRVRIVLGDHVLVKAEGLDARLEGSLRLSATSLITEEITAQGEIRVAQGHFATYGVRLRIERGTILFAGGPVDRPTLDILALRTIGEIKAGVRVTGTPRNPELVLYSEPSMPDSDVLAYMILGNPVGQGEGNVSLLMTAAGALLTQGESAVLQDRLKRLLGVDVLEVEAGDGDVEGSQITIGKYLSPDLYISFGQALFANTNVVRLRYDLSRKWQLESTVGDESGVDLYYRIEFR